MLEAGWHASLVSALWQRKQGCCKWNHYIASARPARTTQRKPVSKMKIVGGEKMGKKGEEMAGEKREEG